MEFNLLDGSLTNFDDLRIDGKKLHVYLSRDALVSESGRFITRGGYIREDSYRTAPGWSSRFMGRIILRPSRFRKPS